MRPLRCRVIDSDGSSVQHEPIELFNSPRRVVGIAHRDEAKSARAVGLVMATSQLVPKERDRQPDPLVVDDHDFCHFSVPGKLVFQIRFTRTNRQAEYAKYRIWVYAGGCGRRAARWRKSSLSGYGTRRDGATHVARRGGAADISNVGHVGERKVSSETPVRQCCRVRMIGHDET